MSVVQFLPWAPHYEKKLLNLFIFLLILSSCEIDSKDYFPFSNGTKWLYSIKINSSYTGKEYEKRLMITNVSSEKKRIILLRFLNYIQMEVFTLTKSTNKIIK